MTEYRDPITGYLVRRYTDGPERNAKLYFTTENFSTDDRYFYFNKDVEGGQETWRGEIATGEVTQVTDKAYCGFALDREKNVAYVCRNETEVFAVDLTTNELTKVGDLPAGGKITGLRRLPRYADRQNLRSSVLRERPLPCFRSWCYTIR